MDGDRAILLDSTLCQVTHVVLMTVNWDPGPVMGGWASFTASKNKRTITWWCGFFYLVPEERISSATNHIILPT